MVELVSIEEVSHINRWRWKKSESNPAKDWTVHVKTAGSILVSVEPNGVFLSALLTTMNKRG